MLVVFSHETISDKKQHTVNQIKIVLKLNYWTMVPVLNMYFPQTKNLPLVFKSSSLNL